VDWDFPLSISIFKGKKEAKEELGVWFRQGGETVKAYFTRDNPRGMPQATQDPDTKEWDFRSQHRWLIQHLRDNTIPDLDAAAVRSAPPVQPDSKPEPEPEPAFDPNAHFEITDADVPF